MSKGLHHVSITVKDFDATVELYTKGFGFKPSVGWGKEGEKRAVMLDMGDGAFLEVFSGREDAPTPDGIIAHLALASDDTDADFQRAVNAGAGVQMEPKTVNLPTATPTPVRIAFVTGLDGESIEFFQYV
jgi:glyoxylase I family protein